MHLKLLALLTCLLCCIGGRTESSEELIRLEAEMLKYISYDDRDTFNKVTNQLKDTSKKAGDERMFYTAWGNQAIYEATHKDYPKAMGIVSYIMDDAKKNGSVFGEYAAMHAKAVVLLQEQDYSAAERAFLDAVDFRHKHFPNESAGEDLQELMKIANHRKDGPAGVRFARQILAEPNVAPIHKGRALYRLSQMAMNKNDVEEFNRIYAEMMELKKTDGIGTLRPLLEVNYHIINGNFEEALRLTDDLNDEERAERRAVIYHRMGDNEQAYKSMQLYKRICDSITLVSHGNVVASCYVQMNNERMKLEQTLLEQQNHRLRSRLYLALGACVILVLILIIFHRHKTINQLLNDIKKLNSDKNDSERRLEEITMLSMYDSQVALPLTSPLHPNNLCHRLTTAMQKSCRRGVTIVFMSDLGDDFVLKTNREAMEKLLRLLLDNAVRFTRKGTVTLKCSDSGENILFSVSDTSPHLDTSAKKHDMHDDQSARVNSISMSLNICHSISRLLQGHIWLDNEYAAGNRFCFEVPKDPQDAGK